MKKIFLVIAVLITSLSLNLNAQEHKVGDIRINAGVGVPVIFSDLFIPPVSVSADYLLKNDLFDGQAALTVGGYFGYFAQRSSSLIPYFNVKSVDTYNYGIFGAKSKMFYDLFKVKGLKTYASLMLGCNVYRTSRTINGNSSSEMKEWLKKNPINGFTFGWNTAVGATYEIAPKLDVYGELGYGISFLELGISYKL